MKIKAILLPFLLGIFPVLFIYAQNAYETEISEIILPLGIVIGVVGCLMVVLRIFKVDRLAASLFASLGIFSFFIFGPLVEQLSSNSIYTQAEFINPVWLALLVIIIIGLFCSIEIFRLKNKRAGLISGVSFIVSMLILWQIVQGGYVLATRDYEAMKPSEPKPISQVQNSSDNNYPDIYYLILDGYGRQDILKEYYDYDNSDFIDFLSDNNFFIADSSTSNYAQTLLSLASSLNLNYLKVVLKGYHLNRDRLPLAEKLRDNIVFSELREHGYSIITFATGLLYSELEDQSDIYLSPKVSLSQYDNILLSYTPLPILFDFKKNQYNQHRQRIDFVFDEIPNLVNNSSPKFVMAHIIAPHPPFVFDEDGGSLEADRPYSISDGDGFYMRGGDKKEYLKRYRGQVTYITKRTTELVENILNNSEGQKPIIILQGDHGPGSGTFWGFADSTDVHERMSILNAYHLPLMPDSLLYNSISPVNSFRLIFNNYFGREYELLPDSVYFSTYAYPFHFVNVTDRVNEKKIIK